MRFGDIVRPDRAGGRIVPLGKERQVIDGPWEMIRHKT